MYYVVVIFNLDPGIEATACACEFFCSTSSPDAGLLGADDSEAFRQQDVAVSAEFLAMSVVLADHFNNHIIPVQFDSSCFHGQHAPFNYHGRRYCLCILSPMLTSWVIFSTSVTVDSEGSFLDVFVFFGS